MDKFAFTEMFAELDGGVVDQKSTRVIMTAAAAVAETRKPGKVVIELTMKPIGDSNQLEIGHTIKLTKPTRRGKATEEDGTTTPMYVGPNGELSIAPLRQIDLFKAEKESV